MGTISIGKVGHGKEVHVVTFYKMTVKSRQGDVEIDMARACCGTGDIGRGERRSSNVTKINGATPVTCSKCLKIMEEHEKIAADVAALKVNAAVDGMLKALYLIGRYHEHGF